MDELENYEQEFRDWVNEIAHYSYTQDRWINNYGLDTLELLYQVYLNEKVINNLI